MGYHLPTWTDYVSCSWQCHKNRNPPSSEPGTDYAAGYGSDVYAPEAGTVVDTKGSNSGAMGRYVAIALGDGRTTRCLHMSRIDVSIGQRVSRGQRLGLSGASGYGDDWYYGPHAHQTLWPGAAWAAPTIDFALYVGSAPSPTPPPTPDDPDEEDEVSMKGAYYTRAKDKATVYLLFNEVSGWWAEHSGVAGNYNNTIAKNWETNSWSPITEAHANVIKTALNAVKPSAAPSSFSVDISESDARAAVALADQEAGRG